MDFKTVLVDVDKIIPYENNSRTHTQEQIEQIANSIMEFGFTNPVLIDEKNTILAGHGRLKAAKYLSIDKIPTVQILGLNEKQKKAYVIADNKIALNASWDDNLLKAEIEALENMSYDLNILGWDVLPDFKDEIDYSILDNADLTQDLVAMTDGVKRAIQIEFESEHYEEASELVNFWRSQGAYVGGLIMDFLRKEKDKI
jgi:ParB family transcriptional regulator, chromosome partitioning protein